MLRRSRHEAAGKMVCPRCGKSRIHPGGSLGWGMLPVAYVCEDCGYRGHLVVEVDVDDSRGRE